MTQTQKGIIAFVLVPLIFVVLMRVFSPGQAYPTGGSFPGEMVFLGFVVSLSLIALLFLIYRSIRIKD